MTAGHLWTISVGGTIRKFKTLKFERKLDMNSPTKFEAKIDYSSDIDFMDIVLMKRNGTVEWKGYVEDMITEWDKDGRYLTLKGRDASFIIWKKYLEDFGNYAEKTAGFFGEVNSTELILFLLRSPHSDPANTYDPTTGWVLQYPNNKEGWGLDSSKLQCSAYRTKVGDAQWTVLRRRAFGWRNTGDPFVDSVANHWGTVVDTVSKPFVLDHWTSTGSSPYLNDTNNATYIKSNISYSGDDSAAEFYFTDSPSNLTSINSLSLELWFKTDSSYWWWDRAHFAVYLWVPSLSMWLFVFDQTCGGQANLDWTPRMVDISNVVKTKSDLDGLRLKVINVEGASLSTYVGFTRLVCSYSQSGNQLTDDHFDITFPAQDIMGIYFESRMDDDSYPRNYEISTLGAVEAFTGWNIVDPLHISLLDSDTTIRFISRQDTTSYIDKNYPDGMGNFDYVFSFMISTTSPHPYAFIPFCLSEKETDYSFLVSNGKKPLIEDAIHDTNSVTMNLTSCFNIGDSVTLGDDTHSETLVIEYVNIIDGGTHTNIVFLSEISGSNYLVSANAYLKLNTLMVFTALEVKSSAGALYARARLRDTTTTDATTDYVELSLSTRYYVEVLKNGMMLQYRIFNNPLMREEDVIMYERFWTTQDFHYRFQALTYNGLEWGEEFVQNMDDYITNGEQVNNGNFDTGNFDGWNNPSENPEVVNSSVTTPHSAPYCAYFYAIELGIYQNFNNIPKTSVESFTLWHKAKVLGGTAGPLFKVVLHYSDSTSTTISLTDATDTWNEVNLLASWTDGKLLSIIELYSETGALIEQFIDDVSLITSTIEQWSRVGGTATRTTETSIKAEGTGSQKIVGTSGQTFYFEEDTEPSDYLKIDAWIYIAQSSSAGAKITLMKVYNNDFAGGPDPSMNYFAKISVLSKFGDVTKWVWQAEGFATDYDHTTVSTTTVTPNQWYKIRLYFKRDISAGYFSLYDITSGSEVLLCQVTGLDNADLCESPDRYTYEAAFNASISGTVYLDWTEVDIQNGGNTYGYIYGSNTYTKIVSITGNVYRDVIHSWNPININNIRIRITDNDLEHSWAVSQVYIYGATPIKFRPFLGGVKDTDGNITATPDEAPIPPTPYHYVGGPYIKYVQIHDNFESAIGPVNVARSRVLDALNFIVQQCYDEYYNVFEWWIALDDDNTLHIASQKGSDKSSTIVFEKADESLEDRSKAGGVKREKYIDDTVQRVYVVGEGEQKTQQEASVWVESSEGMDDVKTFYEEIDHEKSLTPDEKGNPSVAEIIGEVYIKKNATKRDQIVVTVSKDPYDSMSYDVGDEAKIIDSLTGTNDVMRIMNLEMNVDYQGEVPTITFGYPQYRFEDEIQNIYTQLKKVGAVGVIKPDWTAQGIDQTQMSADSISDTSSFEKSAKNEEATTDKDIRNPQWSLSPSGSLNDYPVDGSKHYQYATPSDGHGMEWRKTNNWMALLGPTEAHIKSSIRVAIVGNEDTTLTATGEVFDIGMERNPSVVFEIKCYEDHGGSPVYWEDGDFFIVGLKGNKGGYDDNIGFWFYGEKEGEIIHLHAQYSLDGIKIIDKMMRDINVGLPTDQEPQQGEPPDYTTFSFKYRLEIVTEATTTLPDGSEVEDPHGIVTFNCYDLNTLDGSGEKNPTTVVGLFNGVPPSHVRVFPLYAYVWGQGGTSSQAQLYIYRYKTSWKRCLT